jgi:hypothetical protein
MLSTLDKKIGFDDACQAIVPSGTKIGLALKNVRWGSIRLHLTG